MQHVRRALIFALLGLWLTGFPGMLHAAADREFQVDHELAKRIEELKERGDYSSEDFNACQITWTTRALEKTSEYSAFAPHEVTFQYENKDIITLTNTEDGEAQSVQDLGPHCLEFNNYIYLFFDTLDYETRIKFGLSDLAYVTYSSDQGKTWSDLKSLHAFSAKARFSLPHDKFSKYVKILGNDTSFALSIFNLRDETTYLFDPEFKILKAVSVYNRLTSYDYPADFYWHNDTLYLMRGSCENIKGRLRCPARAYLETSKDFGKTWKRENMPYVKKSYFQTWNDTLYQFYSTTCRQSWLGLIPGINREYRCGYLYMRELKKTGAWTKPKVLLDTVERLFGVYKDKTPVFVWQDYRFHTSRPCGLIPVVGCIDGLPVYGPTAIYAGDLDLATGKINEKIISYKP